MQYETGVNWEFVRFSSSIFHLDGVGLSRKMRVRDVISTFLLHVHRKNNRYVPSGSSFGVVIICPASSFLQ